MRPYLAILTATLASGLVGCAPSAPGDLSEDCSTCDSSYPAPEQRDIEDLAVIECQLTSTSTDHLLSCHVPVYDDPKFAGAFSNVEIMVAASQYSESSWFAIDPDAAESGLYLEELDWVPGTGFELRVRFSVSIAAEDIPFERSYTLNPEDFPADDDLQVGSGLALRAVSFVSAATNDPIDYTISRRINDSLRKTAVYSTQDLSRPYDTWIWDDKWSYEGRPKITAVNDVPLDEPLVIDGPMVIELDPTGSATRLSREDFHY